MRWLPAILLLSCDGGDKPRVTREQATPMDPASCGGIRGWAALEGTPPPNPKISITPGCHHAGDLRDERVVVTNGRLGNAFVYVKKGLEAVRFATPETPVTIANEGCLYVPRVVGAVVHQTIRLVNQDGTAHNVNCRGVEPFNVTLSGIGARQDIHLQQPQVGVALRCDLHPWMIGYLSILEHPKFAVTGADGAFAIEGLPAGTYELAAWHEVFGEQVRTLRVEAAKTTATSFTFQQ